MPTGPFERSNAINTLVESVWGWSILFGRELRRELVSQVRFFRGSSQQIPHRSWSSLIRFFRLTHSEYITQAYRSTHPNSMTCVVQNLYTSLSEWWYAFSDVRTILNTFCEMTWYWYMINLVTLSSHSEIIWNLQDISYWIWLSTYCLRSLSCACYVLLIIWAIICLLA